MFYSNSNTPNIIDNTLGQGKKLLNYNKSIYDITSPNFELVSRGRVIESMSNHELSDKDKKRMVQLEELENNFNRTLSEYNNVYQQFNEDLMNRYKSNKQIADYLGKNVNSNGKIAYINNFGYYHHYNRKAWNKGNPDESCPSDTTDYSKKLPGVFKVGPKMNVGQPCDVAGTVIKNTDTGESAWVDIKGYKHIFPQETDMSSSCSKINVTNMSSSDYNTIPSKKSMTSSDECLAMDVNIELWSKLQKLNKKLKRQAQKLNNELETLHVDSDITDQELQTQRVKMQQYILDIDNDNNNLLYNQNMLMQMSGEEEDSSLRMTANYYGYLVWIFLMVLIGSLTMKMYLGEASNEINPIAYLISGILLLMIIIYLYNKYNKYY